MLGRCSSVELPILKTASEWLDQPPPKYTHHFLATPLSVAYLMLQGHKRAFLKRHETLMGFSTDFCCCCVKTSSLFIFNVGIFYSF